MISAASITVQGQLAVMRLRLMLIVLGATLLALLSAGLFLLNRPLVPVVLIGGLVAAMLLWRSPRLGVYLLCAGAPLLDQYRVRDLPFTLPTAWVPWWESVSGYTHGGIPIPFTPAEMVLGGSLGFLLLRRAHAGRWPLLRGGRLLWPSLALSAVLVFGLVRGITHQDPQTPYPFSLEAAVAEITSLVYLPLIYLLVHNTIETPGQVRTLMWVVIAALGLKALQGTWTAIRVGAALNDLRETATHEDSLFLVSQLVLTLGLWVFRAPRAQRLAVALLLPLVLVALIANQRRAGYISLAVGLAVASAFILSDRRVRGRFLAGMGVLVLVLASYTALFWNASGPLALPVYSFRSILTPQDRDVSSNFWRTMENDNIEHTIRESPWLGFGFGRRYVPWINQPALDVSFTYWRYITHNAIYWLWIKMGAIGFAVFWYVVGSAMLLGALVFRRLREGWMRALTLAVVALFAMQLVFSYADLGLTSARNLVYLGAWMGVLATMDRLTPGTSEEAR